MVSYAVMLDVPRELIWFVSRLLAARRRQIGTRKGTGRLGCYQQAVFALAWFRDKGDISRFGRGFCRYSCSASPKRPCTPSAAARSCRVARYVFGGAIW